MSSSYMRALASDEVARATVVESSSEFSKVVAMFWERVKF